MQDSRCSLTGKDVVHFAPERCIRDLAQRLAKTYLSTDLSTGKEQLDYTDRLDLALDITAIGMMNSAVDMVICNHVLDQVDNDIAALREIFRILRPGGVVIFSMPIVEGWEHTFADPNIGSPRERLKYFGLEERIRYYGRDFPTRVERAGFVTEVFQPHFHAYSEYGLVPGDKIFIGIKP
jgi:SAM-dependent methyltransferase